MKQFDHCVFELLYTVYTHACDINYNNSLLRYTRSTQWKPAFTQEIKGHFETESEHMYIPALIHPEAT